MLDCFSEVEPAFHFLITALKTTHKEEYFTLSSSYSDSQSPLQKAKYDVFPYFIRPRDFIHLNFMIEGSAM